MVESGKVTLGPSITECLAMEFFCAFVDLFAMCSVYALDGYGQRPMPLCSPRRAVSNIPLLMKTAARTEA